MKKLGLLILIGAVLLGIVIANSVSFGKVEISDILPFNRAVKGSGNVVSETRDSSSFNYLRVSGVFEVKVVVGESPNIEIEAEDNLIPLISTEIEQGVLRIRTTERIKPSKPVIVKVSVENLEKVKASGATVIDLENVDNSSLSIDLSGMAKLTASGKTEDLTVNTSGASSVETSKLSSSSAAVNASGSSVVAVTVSETLVARSSGASRIRYSGSPRTVDQKKSGSSRIDTL